MEVQADFSERVARSEKVVETEALVAIAVCPPADTVAMVTAALQQRLIVVEVVNTAIREKNI